MGRRIRQRCGWRIAEDEEVAGSGQQDWKWWFLRPESRHGGRIAPLVCP